jgi:hypothetical protein
MLRVCLSWLCFIAAPSTISAEEPKPTEKASYVEIDFSPLPQNGKGRYKLQFTILTTDKDIKLSESADFDRKDTPEGHCEGMAMFLNINRWKAEVVDKTKLRIHGRIFNDKLIPATKGMVESKDLKPEELPKVKNPPQA